MNIIIHGPQGCGKSHHAAALAAHFGCLTIIDPWETGTALPACDGGVMALTSSCPEDIPPGARLIGFSDACAQAGIHVS